MNPHNLAPLPLLAACAAAPTAAPADPWSATVSAAISAESRAFYADGDGFRASVHAVGLRARIDASGLTFEADDDDGLSVVLDAWGRDGAMLGTTQPAPALGGCSGERAPSGACLPRVEISHDGLVEWWASRRTGLEQGFELDEAPAGEGPLWLDLAMDGLLDVEVQDELAWLTDTSGRVWTVSGLAAWDADGAPLDIGLRATDHGLALWVDDAGARYPVSIDPAYTTADTTFSGATDGDEFGCALASAGDVNGDGYDDVIIGAPWYGEHVGMAYIFHGSSAGLSTTADTTLTGPDIWSLFGYAVAGAGDVNADGYDDVIIGAQYVGYYYGAAYVYHGSSTGVDTTADQTLSGETNQDFFGYVVDGAGDVNADGYDDVLVGTPYANATDGQIWVYHGSASGVESTATAIMKGLNGQDYLGHDARGAGDVNGDGYDDIIAGAPNNSYKDGRAYVYVGGATGVNTHPALALISSTPGVGLGGKVDGAGDVNGDGYDDLIVYASTYTEASANIFHGSSPLDNTLDADISGGEPLFYALARGVGDVNGDGYDDLLIADRSYGPDEDTKNGRAWLHLGSASGLDTAPYTTFTPVESNTQFGLELAGAGDVNGDGYDDILIGAEEPDDGLGQAMLYLGPAEPDPGDTAIGDDSGDSSEPVDSEPPTADSDAPVSGKEEGGRCATGPGGTTLGLFLALAALGRRRR